MSRLVYRLVALILLAGCPSGSLGAPCARHSDCASRVCRTDGTCSALVDAAIDAAPDAYAQDIPPYPEDAATD